MISDIVYRLFYIFNLFVDLHKTLCDGLTNWDFETPLNV